MPPRSGRRRRQRAGWRRHASLLLWLLVLIGAGAILQQVLEQSSTPMLERPWVSQPRSLPLVPERSAGSHSRPLALRLKASELGSLPSAGD
jgi:hypothetical protein